MNFLSKLFKYLDKKDRHYVSDADKIMQQFDETHEKSTSQLKEIAKHQKIFYRRKEQTIW